MFLREDKNYTDGLNVELYPEQIEGVEFLLQRPSAVLGLQTGFGKSIITLTAAYNILKQRNDVVCMIICPKSANSIFIKEMETKIKQPFSFRSTDINRVNGKARFWFYNYSSFKYYQHSLQYFKEKGYKILAIFDEAHILQSDESKISSQINAIRNQLSVVWALTATPLLNDIMGLYNLMNFVQPNILGTFWDFQGRYILFKERSIRMRGKIKKVRDVAGYKYLDNLKERIAPITLIKKRVYPINWHYYNIELSDKDKTAYKLMANGIREDMPDKEFGARLHDLQRVCDGSHKDFNLECAKLDLLFKNLDEILSRGEGTLIYTEYEDTYKFLENAIRTKYDKTKYHRLLQITGKTPYTDRVDIEKNLKAKDILIITKAGCQSLNLQAVNNIIIYNISFSVGFFIQLLGRIARINSQYSQLHIHLPYIKQSIDEYKIELIKMHASLIEYLFGKESNLPEQNTDFVDFQELDVKRSELRSKLLWGW